MKRDDKFFKGVISIFAFFSISLLFLIFLFIVMESGKFFESVALKDFLFGTTWRKGTQMFYGLLPVILATIYTSIIAVIIALPVSIGISIFIVGYVPERYKKYILNFLNILAGIPSVVYGFLGLTLLVKFFEDYFDFATGESVLAGGILLALIVLPYMVSITVDKMQKSYSTYSEVYKTLGISKDYFIRTVVLKDARKNIIAGIVLALGRAFGETMAVMMVIGNAPIMPTLFGKSQTIASLIALEMGMAEVGSVHYHSLYAAGLVLMVITIITNIIFAFITRDEK